MWSPPSECLQPPFFSPCLDPPGPKTPSAAGALFPDSPASAPGTGHSAQGPRISLNHFRSPFRVYCNPKQACSFPMDVMLGQAVAEKKTVFWLISSFVLIHTSLWASLISSDKVLDLQLLSPRIVHITKTFDICQISLQKYCANPHLP